MFTILLNVRLEIWQQLFQIYYSEKRVLNIVCLTVLWYQSHIDGKTILYCVLSVWEKAYKI